PRNCKRCASSHATDLRIGKARTLSPPRARRPANARTGPDAHLFRARRVLMNTTTNTAINSSTGLQSLSISQRIIAGTLALMLGLTLLVGTGFAGDYRLHNGAHDTRHAMGFPCH